jgi:hypothetical protein
MKVRLLPLILLLCFFLSACGASSSGEEPGSMEPEEPPTDTRPAAETEPAAEPEAEEEENEPQFVSPLTGLAIPEEDVGKRPVAVMLNNLKAAMPQYGVSSADIIYEVPAEGGITRMLAVFQSMEGVGRIGSVRSARPYFLDLAQGLDAIFLHAGGSEQAYSDIKTRGRHRLGLHPRAL